MEGIEVFYRLGLALGLGLLVGLEREYAAKPLAGIRTFPLITLGGAVTALAANEFGGWVVAAGIVALAALLLVGSIAGTQKAEHDPGVTTEAAAMLMFVIGVVVMAGYMAVGVVVGGIAAVLLHWKQPLHDFVTKIGPKDFTALIRLVIIALIILPLLPDEAYGPWDAFNPFRMWLLVVLVVAITLAAYVAYRLLGPKVGTLLSGALGGLISSTATTVSSARQTRDNPDIATNAAIVIMIASTVVFGRVLFEIAAVDPSLALLNQTWMPLTAMMVFTAMVAGGAWLVRRREIEAPLRHEPPSVMKAAIVFGILYGVIKLGVAAANHYFGQGALYGVAVISGLTDMDAITLSVAQMAAKESISPDYAWRLILVAGLSNNVFKAIVATMLGTWALGARLAVLFGITLAGGMAIWWFWPVQQ